MRLSGPLGLFDNVERIAVLRGGGLGDLIIIEPALRALKGAYPWAGITLLGMPSHDALLRGRSTSVDRVEILPFSQGIRDGEEDPDATRRWLGRLRNASLDLAVQLHGGGRFSNPFLERLGARHTVGMATPDARALERTVPYVHYHHETLRALEVVALAGAAPVGLEARIDLKPGEHDQVRGLPGLENTDAPLLVIHPGASDPRRRWPADRFARVAAGAVRGGGRVVVVGDDSEVDLAQVVVQSARASLGGRGAGQVTSLAGQLSLSELIGVFSHATVVLGNDSGPRHLAQAVGAATVGIYWVGNLINAGPLVRTRHRAQVSWTTHCPVCGTDATIPMAPRCTHDVSFVSDVGSSAVAEDVAVLMATNRPLPER